MDNVTTYKMLNQYLAVQVHGTRTAGFVCCCGMSYALSRHDNHILRCSACGAYHVFTWSILNPQEVRNMRQCSNDTTHPVGAGDNYCSICGATTIKVVSATESWILRNDPTYECTQCKALYYHSPPNYCSKCRNTAFRKVSNSPLGYL